MGLTFEDQITAAINTNHPWGNRFAMETANRIRGKGYAEADMVSIKKHPQGIMGVEVTFKNEKITTYI